jgi:hypothetical protein
MIDYLRSWSVSVSRSQIFFWYRDRDLDQDFLSSSVSLSRSRKTAIDDKPGPEFDSQVSAVAPTPGHAPLHIQFTRFLIAAKINRINDGPSFRTQDYTLQHFYTAHTSNRQQSFRIKINRLGYKGKAIEHAQN